MHFWQEYHRRDVSSQCTISGGTWCHFCPITSDNSDHLPSFSTSKVTFFFFYKDLIRRYLRLYKYQVSIKLSPTSFNIYWKLLPGAIITIAVAKWWFANLIIPSIFIFYSKEKLLCSIYYSFIYLFTHISTDS